MKFIIFKDRRGEYRWHLKARNGRKIADGGEGYKTRSGVQKAIGRINLAIADHSIPIVEK